MLVGDGGRVWTRERVALVGKVLWHTDRTVITRILALCACAFEFDATDAARVVGVFGEVPFPFGNGVVGGESDLHVGG